MDANTFDACCTSVAPQLVQDLMCVCVYECARVTCRKGCVLQDVGGKCVCLYMHLRICVCVTYMYLFRIAEDGSIKISGVNVSGPSNIHLTTCASSSESTSRTAFMYVLCAWDTCPLSCMLTSQVTGSCMCCVLGSHSCPPSTGGSVLLRARNMSHFTQNTNM